MTRFVVDPDVALHLAEIGAEIPAEHELLAPTLLRSQILARLYEAVRRGDIDRKSANAKLDYLRSLKLRLLGDRVLQRVCLGHRQATGLARYIPSRISRLSPTSSRCLHHPGS